MALGLSYGAEWLGCQSRIYSQISHAMPQRDFEGYPSLIAHWGLVGKPGILRNIFKGSRDVATNKLGEQFGLCEILLDKNKAQLIS